MPYVYAHFRASTKTCFYVGKGSGDRITAKDNRNFIWHRTVNKHGLIAVKLKDFATDEEAYEFEKKAIGVYRKCGHKLVNLTEGGKGPSGYHFTDEVRAKMREKAKTRPSVPCSPEKAAKIGASNRGKKRSPEHRALMLKIVSNPSQETRDKLSAAGLGRKHSEETLIKMSAWQKGRKLPSDQVEKIRERMIGRKNPNLSKLWKTPEHKTLMSERLKAGWDNPESKARQSEILKARWANPEYRAKMKASREAKKARKDSANG